MGRFCFFLLLLVGCGHDSARENPLDGKLTPPVSIQVTVDDSAASATVSWSVYDGGAEFAQYLVLRQIFDRVSVDTLARLDDRSTTAFTDTSLAPGTAYLYRVSVVNAAGLEIESDEAREQLSSLPAVEITSLTADAVSATASIEWTAYSGPRFERYELLRHSDGITKEIALDSNVTTYVDGGLLGAVPYSYEVVVHTTLGERVVSDAREAQIHAPIASWEVPLESGAWSSTDFVRLSMAGDRVVATVTGEHQTRLLTYDRGGDVIQDQLLVAEKPFHRSGRQVAAGPLDERGRRSMVATQGSDLALLEFDRAGVPVEAIYELSSDGVSTVGEGVLTLGSLVWTARYSDLVLQVDGTTVYESVFEDAPESPPAASELRDFLIADLVDGAYEGWSFSLKLGPPFFDEPAAGPDGDGWLFLRQAGGYRDLPEGAMQLDARSLSVGNRASIGLFRVERASGAVELRFNRDRAWLLRQGASGSERTVVDEVDVASVPFSPQRLQFNVSEQGVHASLANSVRWRDSLDVEERWVTLQSLGDQLAATVGERFLTLTPGGDVLRDVQLDSWVSDVRFRAHSQQVVACFPELHEVRWGRVVNERFWDVGLNNRVGPHLTGAGALNYPVSTDIGPDGRLYVVDAANARVVVLDKEGNFITSIGQPGAGEGAFNFGDGSRAGFDFNYAGSIAVDDEGFIYVADVGNGRIQKFAP